MKTAVIVGCEGQDGRIAFDLLARKNYKIVGIDQDSVKCVDAGWARKIDITAPDQVKDLLKAVQPDEVYFLAACHQSSEDALRRDLDLIRESYRVNVLALAHFLDGILLGCPRARLFYAASSHVFGKPAQEIQDETTPFQPDSIYGISKLDGLLTCRYYRKTRGIFASVGIMYNHESPYRRENFLSKKIVKAAVNIKNGLQDQLTLGDLSAQVDWGYAPDYVEAMHRIVNHKTPDDFIVASGVKHSVREFAEIVFDELGLDWAQYVREDSQAVTRRQAVLVGNPRKLMDQTGWRPTVDFREMIRILLEAERKTVHVA